MFKPRPKHTLQLLFVATIVFTSRGQPTAVASKQQDSHEQPLLMIDDSDTLARLERLEAEWEMLQEALAADRTTDSAFDGCRGWEFVGEPGPRLPN